MLAKVVLGCVGSVKNEFQALGYLLTQNSNCEHTETEMMRNPGALAELNAKLLMEIINF